MSPSTSPSTHSYSSIGLHCADSLTRKPCIDLATSPSTRSGHANDIFYYIKLPLPPEIPPTKLRGVSVEQRVEQFESRSALESMLDNVGLAKGESPLNTLEYKTDPHNRHSNNIRVWCENDSDYERMELRLEDPTLHPPNQSLDLMSSSMFSTLTLDCNDSIHQNSSVVQFTGKSGLFMTSSPNPVTSSSNSMTSSDKQRQKSGSMDSGYWEDELSQRSTSCSASKNQTSHSEAKPRLASISTNKSSKISTKRKAKLATFLCHGINSNDDMTDDDSSDMTSQRLPQVSVSKSNPSRRYKARDTVTPDSIPVSRDSMSRDSLLSDNTDSLYEIIGPRHTETTSRDACSESRDACSESHTSSNVVQFTSKSSLLYKPPPKTSPYQSSVYRSLDTHSTVSSMYEVLTDKMDDDYYQILDYSDSKKEKALKTHHKKPKKPKRRVSKSHYENIDIVS